MAINKSQIPGLKKKLIWNCNKYYRYRHYRQVLYHINQIMSWSIEEH